MLDEADRLLEPSFADELRTVLSALPQQGRQTLLFSATMTKSLIKLQSAALKDAFVHRAYDGLRTADKLKEEYVFMPAKVRRCSCSYPRFAWGLPKWILFPCTGTQIESTIDRTPSTSGHLQHVRPSSLCAHSSPLPWPLVR